MYRPILLVLVIEFVIFLDATRKIPVYEINLDLEPEKRWTHIIKNEGDGLKELVAAFKAKGAKDHMYGPIWWIFSQFIGYTARQSWNSEYLRELEGIAQVGNFYLGDLAIAQLWYEFTTYGSVAYGSTRHSSYGQACTSLIAQDKNGVIWHGRNLDYYFGDLMKRTLIYVDFKKNNKVLFSTLTWPGYIGSMTGQRPGAFSISQNTRVDGTLYDTLIAFWQTNMENPHSFAMRYALEHLETYGQAVNYLERIPFMAPGYFIIAGTEPGEGVILSRNRLDNADTWELKNGFPKENPFYILETNFDHWEPPGDLRREAGLKAMNKEGRENMGLEGILRVLSTDPVLNNSTLFTTIMVPARPKMMFETAVIREEV